MVRRTLSTRLITGSLSRAETECEGRATTEPTVAGSTLSALDSNPTNIIDPGWGQDGLRLASIPSFGKSCPQPNRIKIMNMTVSQLEKAEQDRRSGGEAAARKRLRREDGGHRHHPLY
jgi:hypothetical protein